MDRRELQLAMPEICGRQRQLTLIPKSVRDALGYGEQLVKINLPTGEQSYYIGLERVDILTFRMLRAAGLLRCVSKNRETGFVVYVASHEYRNRYKALELFKTAFVLSTVGFYERHLFRVPKREMAKAAIYELCKALSVYMPDAS